MGFRSILSRKKKLRPPPIVPRTHVEELSLVFKKFDTNGDGKISSSELGSIMNSLGQPSTPGEVEKMVTDVDKNNDGCIDLDEFIELNTKNIDSDESLRCLKDAFSVFDTDGDGGITAEELWRVMRSLGEDCDLGECRKMILEVDVDGDGMVCFEEFKIMMQNQQ